MEFVWMIPIPEKDETFVPFGYCDDIMKIMTSLEFCPVLISGHTGTGKTYPAEQCAAYTGRKFIHLPIDMDTAEDTLIGSIELIEKNGTSVTTFREGPIIRAMREGAVVLLDELDCGIPAKLMCLQSILDGKSYFIKHTQERVFPARGFNVVATANTKGAGDDTGQYVGTNVQNLAFLERFPVNYDQDYPEPEIEKEILTKVGKTLSIEPKDVWLNLLVLWANKTRTSYREGHATACIPTRRLVQILKVFNIFKDQNKAVQLCMGRYNESERGSFLDLYNSLYDERLPEMDDLNKVPF